MAVHKRVNPFSKPNNDTGFGTNADNYGGRFINRDGTFNMRKEGMPFWSRFSIYHTMLNLPTWKFGAVIILWYIGVNLIYTFLYLFIGVHQLGGITAITGWAQFRQVFYFSAQTFTTVGYGRINPVGDAANLLAALEAVNGFLSFAVATGLIYGRFSKPQSYLIFSDYALVAPYHDKQGLIFRFASYKDNHILTNVEIQVTIGLQLQENGESQPHYKYFDLALERNRVDSLPMNWTVVHPIDENSPLVGFTEEDMKTADVELYVLIRGFDDVYSNFVLQRTSYTYQEIKFNKKFVPMYRESDDGKTTILELHKLNQYIELKKD
jgi:inward rectifier potassium channel